MASTDNEIALEENEIEEFKTRFTSDKRRKVSGGRWKRPTSSGDIKIATGYTRRAAIIASTTIIRFQDIKDSESNYNHYDVE